MEELEVKQGSLCKNCGKIGVDYEWERKRTIHFEKANNGQSSVQHFSTSSDRICAMHKHNQFLNYVPSCKKLCCITTPP